MTQMTPPEIVSELDKHIVGQDKAKKAVAIALRNRWRRAQVEEPLRSEITPKNILMIGPTGVGKTEIARRLARLANAPFIKIEATKFTEVGYVGRDVDTIIRDLMEIAIKDGRERAMKSVRDRALDAAEDRVLDALLPPARPVGFNAEAEPAQDSATRQKFRKKLREGELDDKEIDIEVAAAPMQAEIFAPPGMEELTQQIQGMFQNLGGGKKKQRKLQIREALKLLADEEAARLINDEEVKLEAVRAVEQNGIVFLDEVDKIAARTDAHGADVSRQGVQRDLLPPARPVGFNAEPEPAQDSATRQKFRKKLREGELDDKEIEIEVAAPSMQAEIFAPPGMEELTQQIQGMFQNLGGGKKKQRKLQIREALKLLADEEAARLINDEEVKLEAVRAVEQNGIVFLDEVDKIAARSDVQGADVSRQGVQRDLLPLVEGTTISTKYGMIKTDHILFIASGAFHLSKPSDLIPELQGRFPIRVELESLSVEDFARILTSTDACLTRQYAALLATDGVTVEFTDEGIRRLAEIAFQVNEKTENIGARRLYTVMEKLLEEVSFSAGCSSATQTVVVDAAYVDVRLDMLAQREDLARYVL